MRATIRTTPFLAACGILLVLTGAARADDNDAPPAPEDWSLHTQLTATDQYHPPFRSPFHGSNSLDPGSRGNETFDLTFFAGVRLWDGAEAYANPEVDQGFGLSDTFGIAGFPSGEAYKVGSAEPYIRLQRLFLRQTFDLGGETENVDADANQLAGTRTKDNIVITAGKFSVPDIFDDNQYAHDPKNDFLNWSMIDAGAFDYAADAWAYTYGAAVEWTQAWWTLRTGLFDLSRVPNTTQLQRGFAQFEIVSEAEERHTWFGKDGKLKLLGFLNRARMGDYNQAVALANATGTIPSTALVRKYASRPGGSLNLEQGLTDDIGMFARLSMNDGSKEAYEFTEINKSAAMGLSLKGASWDRPDDTVGLGIVVNGISKAAQTYLADGGLGLLIGDGRLPQYGTEDILEAYYSYSIVKGFALSGDYQLVVNPAYDPLRGPVNILALRLHVQT